MSSWVNSFGSPDVVVSSMDLRRKDGLDLSSWSNGTPMSGVMVLVRGWGMGQRPGPRTSLWRLMVGSNS